jgi:hydrogenase nickel incorporation protein HypA/HybF
MHELALAGAIVQICTDNARGGTVVEVELTVGRLRQVVPEALTFAFELVAQGTAADGAVLRIEDVPARVACPACAAETEIEQFPLACGRCGSLAVDVVAGEEFHVGSLEIEHGPVAFARR